MVKTTLPLAGAILIGLLAIPVSRLAAQPSSRSAEWQPIGPPAERHRDALSAASAPADEEELFRLRSQLEHAVSSTDARSRERSERILRLAREVLVRTHHAPANADDFNLAARELLQARLHLALEGDSGDVRALSGDAREIFAMNPDSPAAREALAALVQYAHASAERLALRPGSAASFADLSQGRLPHSIAPEALPQAPGRGEELETIQIAYDVIAQTHGDPEKEELFDVAVRGLLQARLHLALMGEGESVQQLTEDVQAVVRRAPRSRSAREGMTVLASFVEAVPQGAVTEGGTLAPASGEVIVESNADGPDRAAPDAEPEMPAEGFSPRPALIPSRTIAAPDGEPEMPAEGFSAADADEPVLAARWAGAEAAEAATPGEQYVVPPPMPPPPPFVPAPPALAPLAEEEVFIPLHPEDHFAVTPQVTDPLIYTPGGPYAATCPETHPRQVKRQYHRESWHGAAHRRWKPRLGASLYAHMQAHVDQGQAEQMILNHFDFESGTAILNHRGRQKLGRIVRLLPQTFYPVIVEETPQEPHLAIARRAAVLEALALHPFPVPVERVRVGPAIARGLQGEEAEIIRENFHLQTQQRGDVLRIAPGGAPRR